MLCDPMPQATCLYPALSYAGTSVFLQLKSAAHISFSRSLFHTFRASDSCLMLDYVCVINFCIIIIIIIIIITILLYGTSRLQY